MEGNKKIYKANPDHPFYGAIKSFVKNSVGIDRLVEQVVSRIGDLDKAYITGSFAKGINSDIIELALVGDNLDAEYIEKLVKKAETIIGRKIIYLILNSAQMEHFFKGKTTFLIWDREQQK
jgi:hypothetical protein